MIVFGMNGENTNALQLVAMESEELDEVFEFQQISVLEVTVTTSLKY